MTTLLRIPAIVAALGLALIVGCSSAPSGDSTGVASSKMMCNSVGAGGLHIECGGGGDIGTSSSSSGGSGLVCAYTPGCSSRGPYSLVNDSSDLGYWTSFENQLASLGCGIPFQGSTFGSELIPGAGYTMQFNRYTRCRWSSALDALIAQHPSCDTSPDPTCATDTSYCDSCLGAPAAGYVWVRWFMTTLNQDVCPGGCNGDVCTSCY
jgi:hypothetical protein